MTISCVWQNEKFGAIHTVLNDVVLQNHYAYTDVCSAIIKLISWLGPLDIVFVLHVS